MPVPWVPGRAHVLTPKIEDRALSIKQLRQLRLFLRRLCKTRLLRFTEVSRFSPRYELGAPLQWSKLDLYDITNEVIKKVIPHVLSDAGAFVNIEGTEVSSPPEGKWCSWAEMVMAPGRKQTASIMFSHWWGGAFEDFMAAVDSLVQDKALTMDTMIWICTFSNNQFAEDFGANLHECPFIRVLNIVDRTILIVDRYQGSLSRTWCALELHYSLQKENELELYTSQGQVGSAQVGSGPVIEALQSWDVRNSECSESSYRRQILNYIADVEETEGLKTEDGKLVTVQGRPQLDIPEEEQALDPEFERAAAPSGQKFAYESRLFRKHNQQFDDLNMMIRLEVMAKVGRPRKKNGCRVSDMAERGITLGQWRTFVKKARDTHSRQDWTCLVYPEKEHRKMNWKELNTYHIIDNFVLALTKKKDGSTTSYMELVSEGPQFPNFYVSHVWSDPFGEMASSINRFAEAKSLSDSVKLWICTLSCNLHQNETWFEQSGRIIDHCHGLVACLAKDVSKVKPRAWCLIEYLMFGKAGKDIYLSCKSGTMACGHPLAGGAYVYGSFDANIGRKMSTWRVADCKCSGEPQRILESLGSSRVGAFDRFHAQLQRWCAGVMLRAAAKRGEAQDLDEIREVCRTPGLWINSASLCGAMGESALHLATAAGHLAAMRILLEEKADPNVEDDIQERPLHYAAFTGQVAAAELLLQWGADPHAESFYFETPLCVAQEAPAAFLGTFSTDPVVDALQNAASPTRDSGLTAEVLTTLLGHLSQEQDCEPLSRRQVDLLLQAARGSQDSGHMTWEAFVQWIYQEGGAAAGLVPSE